MSLAVVWSYFHALRESDSDMARHFVLIAPGLSTLIPLSTLAPISQWMFP
jgi:hypothetical protein